MFLHVFLSPPTACKKTKSLFFTSLSYFSKTASPWCFWFRLTVTECRSRWIIPSIQTAAIVIFKRADICWRAERGSFQRNDESPVLDCSERGPHERMRTWQEGVERRKKGLSNNTPPSLSPSRFTPSHTLYISILCTSVFALYIPACCLNSFSVNVSKSIFGKTLKETYGSRFC